MTNNKLNVMGITHCSAVDGPGLRTVVWFQGCRNKCPGCHNPDSWDVDKKEMLCTAEQLYELAAPNKLEDGLTLSGGDPFGRRTFMNLRNFLPSIKRIIQPKEYGFILDLPLMSSLLTTVTGIRKLDSIF